MTAPTTGVHRFSSRPLGATNEPAFPVHAYVPNELRAWGGLHFDWSHETITLCGPLPA